MTLRRIPCGFMRRHIYLSLLTCWMLVVSSPALAQSQGVVSIAAAANLKGVLDALMQLYTKTTGQNLKVVYGSSGHFFQQITQGAKYDIFLSANEEFVDRLVAQDFSAQAGVVYARGRLVLLTSQKSKIRTSADLSDLKNAIQDRRLIKFAIANPALAPYGLAAKQTLEQMGLIAMFQPLFVLGSDVGQTMLFIRSEAAQAGMVPWSIVKQSTQIKEDAYYLIPEKMHQPILQKMILFKTSLPQAQGFYAFLQTPEARVIWQQYGYE